ncbi:UDP-N-acetylmuramoylalanyl-D-glutamate--2,6-diaminopimelate ligase [Aminomonas paucivorans DSM 12260]|uniref:UDP-N-acetylmuramoyl-L-alanyl-D-glutamate--2,6-diaminopimelate ligase n=1 Tax=Aminomonas paucivorans DSM 12260 TaxID=584708 RepID=E3D106_9BACT|nr:UDP-N-acetylmuramoyl-L-alanyl-D-glutamate--2,6-diaminopimelate ligase [Aminomonas paucivorans]EFQ23912.1 UDP-N-acetylmuramoylalanyl-D-glutamate--2,6-diaminopimelate ligase [Aminomonas paucivorans DSM 12260]
MYLNDLLARLHEDPSSPKLLSPRGDNPWIDRVVHHSGNVAPGSLFACVSGGKADGHRFAASALDRGAVALCVERALDLPVPQVVVPDVRRFMGRLAAVLYGEPAQRLTHVGITGTNGKSTTTYMLRSVLQSAGVKTGLLGTIVYHDGDKELEADRTTPENTDIQSFLARMVSNGCGACVMETSSHGLEQGRIEGCRFDRGGFTNLSPEHLDYHGTEEAYFQAKKLLFEEYMKPSWKGASNRDDAYGRRLLEAYPENLVGYTREEPRPGDLGATLKSFDLTGMCLDLTLPDGRVLPEVHLPLIGTYNVENALACAALARTLDIDGETIRRGLASMPQVPGRLERYSLPGGVTCVIDYAHTPDGLEKVLSTLRHVCRGQLWSVFGHGGERTTSHRKALGEHAGRLADRVVVTMDNPRSEDPGAIAEQIVGGIQGSGAATPWEVRLDRGEAIRFALDGAQPGDVVLVSGKGPERNIIFADRLVPFEDRAVVLEWMQGHPSVGGEQDPHDC